MTLLMILIILRFKLCKKIKKKIFKIKIKINRQNLINCKRNKKIKINKIIKKILQIKNKRITTNLNLKL